MNRHRLAALEDARRTAYRRSVATRPEARPNGRVDVNAGPGAPASTRSPARSRGVTAEILFPKPAESAASGYGPARGTAPVLPPRAAARLAGDLRVDAAILRYAELRALQALERFPGVQTIDVLLGRTAAGETTCRLHVTFAAVPAIVVGHSGPAILHAIDTAVETAAHIVAAQTRNEA